MKSLLYNDLNIGGNKLMNTQDELFKIVIDEYSKFKEVDYIYCNIKKNNMIYYL